MEAGSQLIALADPTRRAIFESLARGPMSVSALASEHPVSRPAVSQHLKVLAGSGLVRVSPQGTRRIYSVDPQGLSELAAWVEAMWDHVLDRFEAATEVAIREEKK